MSPLVALHHLVVRFGLAPGRRLTAGWLLRFALVTLFTMVLWAGFMWGLSLLVDHLWAS